MTVLCKSHGSVVKWNDWLFFFFTHFQLMPRTTTPTHQELKKHDQIHNKTTQASCVSLHTFWRHESSLQICYSTVKLEKCLFLFFFPRFLVCARESRDNREDDCTTERRVVSLSDCNHAVSSCFVYVLWWIYFLLRTCCPVMFSSTGQLRGTSATVCLCASAVQRKESIYNIFIHIFIYY